MSNVAQNVRDDLFRLSGPYGPVKQRIARAARRLDWTYSRTFETWYGRAKTTAEEYEQVRRAVRTKQESALSEALDVADQMEAMAARMERVDSQCYGVLADARQSARLAMR